MAIFSETKYMLTLHKRTCKNPHCNIDFEPKDSRQYYHSRDCQQWWNNYKAKQLRDWLKPVNRVLLNNRKILKKILGNSEERIVSKDFLLGAGYEFPVKTKTLAHKNDLYHFVFEYAVLYIDSKVKIIKSNEGLSGN